MADRSEIQARQRALEQHRRAQLELRQFMRRLTFLLVALVVLILVGTVGFSLIEGSSLGFGLAWTLDAITTVGSIPEPQQTAGRVLKVSIELLGIGTLFYGFVTIAEFFVSGQLSGLVEDRRTQRMIDSYSDHYIICGFGRVGRQVARDLRTAGAQHVVIDGNPENREAARAVGVAYIQSGPADDEVLYEAGIERAKAVIACVDSDAENIFIALTARELRDDILIIARASAEDSEKKLLRAGADRVISPYKTSGHEMARVALHPQIAGAVQVADYRMEEIQVPPTCAAVGQSLADVRGTSMIVALRRADGRLVPQPAPDTVIGAGDKVVALGTPDALDRLEEMFQPAATIAKA
jgi:voltage-gated potassium channel